MTCISMFSGGGGLDLGAYFAGFHTLLSTDLNPIALETIKGNLLDTNTLPCNAKDLTADILRNVSGLGGSDLDLTIAGPPCQSFSILGKRNSFADERGQMTTKYIELVGALKPKAFLFENVPGLLNVNGGKTFESLWKYINEATGYQLFVRKCNAQDYGIPQSRERVIIIGFRPDIDCTEFKFPEKASGYSATLLPERVPSKWAFENLQDTPNQQIRMHTKAVRERYEKIPQGGRDAIAHTDRIHPELPSGTVLVGSSAGGGRPHIHPYEPRVITVREAARLQSFPDWYEFHGTMTEQYRQVGNAVPVLMAYEILRNVGCVLLKNK